MSNVTLIITKAVPGCDPSRVRAHGPGLEAGLTNLPGQFTVETKGCGQGSLSLAIEGPSEAKMICKENQNGVCVMEYLPVKAGAYDITIKYAEQHVPGSPFRVNVEDRVDSGAVGLRLPTRVKRSACLKLRVLIKRPPKFFKRPPNSLFT